uniref:Putative endocuticle structural glycoprotein abd-4 n=1 Tax=Corethrella appendiculata TaxID=1370023 RepID=U5ESS7_9DIPT
MRKLIGFLSLITVITHIKGAPMPKPQDEIQQPQQPQQATTPIPILSQTDIVNPDGSFQFGYETGNGIKVDTVGTLKKVPVERFDDDGNKLRDSEEQITVHTGSFSYVSPEGIMITLNFVADENGFHPEGAHIPVWPGTNPAKQNPAS